MIVDPLRALLISNCEALTPWVGSTVVHVSFKVYENAGGRSHGGFDGDGVAHIFQKANGIRAEAWF